MVRTYLHRWGRLCRPYMLWLTRRGRAICCRGGIERHDMRASGLGVSWSAGGRSERAGASPDAPYIPRALAMQHGEGLDSMLRILYIWRLLVAEGLPAADGRPASTTDKLERETSRRA
jgi:hypothetical protein